MDTTPQDPNPISDEQLTALLKRYEDAYTVARVTNKFGTSVQMAGKAIGVILAVGALSLGSGIGGRESLVVAVIGALVGGLIYVLGILISAVGQILTASLDSAVHTSPFLSHRHRTKVMSLPRG